MKTFKITNFGNQAQGVIITGNPLNQEPLHFRIKLPIGEIDIVRVDNGYWIHITNDDKIMENSIGKITNMRIDSRNKNSIFKDKIEGYHLAVKLENL